MNFDVFCNNLEELSSCWHIWKLEQFSSDYKSKSLIGEFSEVEFKKKDLEILLKENCVDDDV
jgi:hypothetical protein